MKNRKKMLSRRNALKAMVAGGTVGSLKALPDTWARPAVSAVMLPAHAATSGCDGSYDNCCGPTNNYGFSSAYTITNAGGNLNLYGASGTLSGTVWSAVNTSGSSSKTCTDGSNSSYYWKLSGTIDGNATWIFRRYCEGIEVENYTSASGTSFYTNGTNIFSSITVTEKQECTDLFKRS
jgi:hypothetical protein